MSWQDTPCIPGGGNGKSRPNYTFWTRHKGPIPPGMQVLHHCDNFWCRNIEHLWLGTQSDNIKDAWNKKRTKGNTGKRWNLSEETKKKMTDSWKIRQQKENVNGK